MTTKPQEGVKIGSYLNGQLTAGEPDVSGPIAVYPVFGPEPIQKYASMSRARTLGFKINEQPGAGSVGDVIVSNPSDYAVLIYEGEEILGGQQNRTFDKSVLIGPGETVIVPVSCVEASRWDGSRNSEDFEPSPQMAEPRLRGEKASQAHSANQAGGEERADQGAVWSFIGQREEELGVDSGTSASSESYDIHRDQLHETAAAINQHEGQIGMVFQVGGRVLALDLVSRPEVFADLHAPLVQGYCHDALGRNTPARVDGSRMAERFLRKFAGNRISENDGIGLGRGFRFANRRAVGTGLLSGEELIQLSVFTNRPDGPEATTPPARRTRIDRPSRRRS